MNFEYPLTESISLIKFLMRVKLNYTYAEDQHYTSERLIVSRSSFSLPLSQGPIQQGKFVSSCALACLIGRSSFMSPCL